MKKFKKLLVGALALCMALSAAACTGGKNPNTSSDDDVDTVSDKFVLQIYSGGYGSEMWNYVIKKFEKAHPEYNVGPHISNTVNDTFKNNWMDGNPPDFVFLDGDTIDKETWLEEGLLYDMTNWLKTATVEGSDEKITDKINMEYAFHYTDEDGKDILYGMPLVISSYGMWYDNAYFTEKNYTVPTKYDELVDWTEKNATSRVPALIYPGAYSGYLVQGFILPALAEVGDDFYKKVETASDPDVYVSKEFKEVMNRFADYVKLNNAVASCASMDHILSQQEWLNHNAAFIPNGLWLRKEMEQRKEIPEGFQMRYTPSPLVKSQQVVVASAVTFGIAKQAKNRKAALEFVKFLYQDDVIQQFVKHSDSPSVAKNVNLDGIEISDVLKYTQSVTNNKDYKFVTHTGSWGGVDPAFNNGVNSIIAGTKTVDQVCKELQDAAKKQLNA